MDKLSTWQLMDWLESKRDGGQTGQRDWMQIFCEDVVEPQYVSHFFLSSINSSIICALFFPITDSNQSFRNCVPFFDSKYSQIRHLPKIPRLALPALTLH